MTPILLTGLSRSGKNYAADVLDSLLSEKHDVGVFSIAYNLKLEVAQLFEDIGASDGPFYEAFPEDRRKKLLNSDMDIVDLWIKFGEFCKTIYPDVWVSQVAGLIRDTDFSIITDLRFNNEYDYLKARFPDTLVVRVIRTDGKEVIRASDEKYTGPVNFIVYNDGTENFEAEIRNVAKAILERK